MSSRLVSSHRDPIRRRALLGLADQQSQQVGLLIEVAIARAVTDGINFHGRQGPELIGQGGDNRCAGRRGQLGLDLGIGQRDSHQQFGRGRGGNTDPAMGDGDEPVAGRNRRTDNAVHPQQVPANSAADDVGDRIDGPHFVKVYLANRRAVHLRLGLAQSHKNSFGQILLRGGQRAGVDSVGYVVQVPVGVLRLVADVDLGGAKALFLDFFSFQPAIGQPQRVDAGLNFRQIDTRIDQRPESHIAADAADRVKIGYFHGFFTGKSIVFVVARGLLI